MTFSKKTEKYDSDSIKILKDLDGLRRKPSIYIGGTDASGILQLLKEAVDNAVDEFLAGRNKLVQVVLGSSKFIVADAAEGVPVGTKELITEDGGLYKISTLTAVFTKLHTGGKFGSKAYKYSGGTHGIGVKAITALSSRLDVWTHRSGTWYHQAFSRGNKLTGVKKGATLPASIIHALPVKPTCGTILMWDPDPQIFGEGTVVDKPELYDYINDRHLLNVGIKIIVRSKAETKVFHNTKGPIAYIEHKLEEYNTVHNKRLESIGKPIIVEQDTFTVALQMTTSTDEHVVSYVNSIRSKNDGQHVDGMWAAYLTALKTHALGKHKYTLKDLKIGMLGYFDYRMQEPQFSAQVKDCLVSDVKMVVKKAVEPVLNAWFEKNKATTRQILNKATEINKARTQSKDLLNALASAKSTPRKGNILPGVLDVALQAKPEDVELFICEGDSSAGCFIGETIVKTTQGNKTFVEMVEGNKTKVKYHGIGFDTEDNTFKEITFDEPHITKYVDELIEVEMDDGSTVQCTTDHPWLLESNTYCAAEDLCPGDELKST